MVSKNAEKFIKDPTKNHDTQVIISPHQKDRWIIFKKTPYFKTYITPFDAYEDETWESGIVVPENRLHRVQNLYENTKEISSYTISIDNISFNCLKGFPPEIFPKDAATGWIHFNHTSTIVKDEKDKKPTVVNQIDDRIAFEEIEEAEIEQSGIHEFEFEMTHKINFKIEILKVFPIIFDRGFILTIADEKKATMYVTLNDVSKLFAGSATKNEFNNLVYNVFPLFPFFNCNVNEKSSTVFLKNINGLRSFFAKTNLPKALVRFRYYFNNPKACTCRIIGR